MSLLDDSFPKIFEIIEAQPAPFDGFDVNDLELSGIYISQGHIDIEFESEACKEADSCPVLRWNGLNFEFRNWTC